MKYEEGDIVLLAATIISIDEEDDTYQVDVQGDDSIWITELCIMASPKPKFKLEQPIAFGKEFYSVDQLSFSPRLQTFQYKVAGHWYNEEELEVINND